jgi:3'(2'), 5'-bisphosphate nucleotidase
MADVSDVSQARLCESVEPSHSDQRISVEVAARLGLAQPPLRIDSQVKYAALASGQASIYLRIPKNPDYREKVWDHAAGTLIVQEAGGVVTDLDGALLDFSQGDTLGVSAGIVAASANIHDKVLNVVRAVIAGG